MGILSLRALLLDVVVLVVIVEIDREWSNPADRVVYVDIGETGPRFGDVALGCRLTGLTGRVIGWVGAVGVLGPGLGSYLVAGKGPPKPCGLVKLRVRVVG